MLVLDKDFTNFDCKRLCIYRGCNEIIMRGNYCDFHKKLLERQKVLLRDKNRKSSAERGYDDRWRKARRAYLIQHPICVKCGRPATEVDHIIPHKGDKNLFWNVGNWQSLCHSCHSRKTMTELRNAKNLDMCTKCGRQAVNETPPATENPPTPQRRINDTTDSD